jgi:predicted O-linked N-acetylglucosamine transferase (SPINDLY family)
MSTFAPTDRAPRVPLRMKPENTDRPDGGRWSWRRVKEAFGAGAARDDAAGLQSAEASYQHGLAAERAGRTDEAVAHYEAAVAAAPARADYRYAFAATLKGARRIDRAVAEYRAGLALKPDDARMRVDLGLALMGLGRLEEAQAEIEQACSVAPDLAEAHHNLGILYHQLGRLDDAIREIRVAHELAPDHTGIHSNLLFILNYSARHTPDEILADHVRFGELHVQPVASPQPDAAWPRRLRVGYVSPDFRSHVVACFMLPILARHDREHFEVYGYYTYAEADEVTAAMRELADGWLDCAELSDAQLADRIRADRIDILVDLAGHTVHHRLKVFALRPAPLQVTYLGYPNTTGLTSIDYRITDAKADPPGEADRLNVEKLARLPRSFLCYRPGPDLQIAEQPPAAQSGQLTFGCFNNFQKLSESFFSAAAKVLAAVPRSRLLLKARALGTPSVAQRVRDRFAGAGIDASRLELLGWESSPESHLAIYRRVDIALDSFPYNGTTTTCEALWMGVPVVAVRGDRHAGRVGASLLETVGLGELVARDVEDYVGIAARLAGDLARLARLRATMRDRLRASPLMDERGFVRELEDCYRAMWRERLAAASGPGAVPAPGAFEGARALRAAGKLAEAKAACEAILRGQPAHEQALALLWDLCHELSENGAAVEWIGRALAAGGAAAPLHYMLGCTLQDLGRLREALAAFGRALELDPGHAKAANNLGCLQEAMGDFEQAEQSYDRALRADPQLANAYFNRGNLARQRGRHAAAEADLQKALALEPGHADWHSSLGEIYALRWQLSEAIAAQRAALELDPSSARAHFGLGNALTMLSRCDEAEASLRRAVELQPDFPEAHSNLLLAMHYRKGDDGPAMYEAHLAWAQRHARDLPRPSFAARVPAQGRRLNIGYVSPNFQQHAVAWAIEPVLAAHDRSRFRTFFYSTVAHPDAVTRRFMKLCDEWRDIAALSSEAAARLVRQDGIDILVDLAGHTGGGRPLLFARKPAPVQVNWQGYPNTTGLAQVDYRITDAHADPVGETERYHTEKLVRLPTGFFCYAPPPDAPEPGEPPVLVTGQITFGSFNNLAKVTPETIALWARILGQLPQARMIMKAHALGDEGARRDVHAHFAAGGIASSRVELFGPEESHGGHLARYLEVDIGLDPFPYHGTATTCEALWMGVPVVTLAGRTHLARVGVSVLRRIKMDELIAATPDEYVRKAVALAGDPVRLRQWRAGLRRAMSASPLLDAAGFARALEAAYLEMWRG